MDRRDTLILAALVGLCANPQHAKLAPGKLAERALAVARGAEAKLADDERGPRSSATDEELVTPASPTGPAKGKVELHTPRHPDD